MSQSMIKAAAVERQLSEIVTLLRTLNEDHARTIILITHDSAIAAAAERTVRLRDGQIVDESRSVAETAG